MILANMSLSTSEMPGPGSGESRFGIWIFRAWARMGNSWKAVGTPPTGRLTKEKRGSVREKDRSCLSGSSRDRMHPEPLQNVSAKIRPSHGPHLARHWPVENDA